MSYLDYIRARAGEGARHPDAAVLRDLLAALEAGAPFRLERLYALPYADFEIALGTLQEWWARRRLNEAEMAA
jgi:hypothetical protein